MLRLGSQSGKSMGGENEKEKSPCRFSNPYLGQSFGEKIEVRCEVYICTK